MPARITLTTDFGTADPYVGAMKGVVATLAPDAHISDITHEIAPYDLLGGALALAAAAPYWPSGTLHVIVVDPGVGSARRPIAASSQSQFFIAPDNGVLEFIFRRNTALEVRHITNEALFRHPVSRTFHGRDIFAPVAAHLAAGTPLSSVGPLIQDFVRLPLPTPSQPDPATLIGHVLKSDRFGNLLTDIPGEHLAHATHCHLQLRQHLVTRVAQNYADSAPGELFAIIGSTNLVEISLNRASAQSLTGAQPGDQVRMRLTP